MKKFIISVLLIFFITVPLMAEKKQSRIDMDAWRYEIVSAGEGQQGSYKIKVWTFSKKTKVSEDLFKKYAVHGVLFNGIPAYKRTSEKKPLIMDPQVKITYDDFFQKFFADGGDYENFVQFTSGTPEIIQVGKENKIGVIVLVLKDDLRKYLENAGIIKALNYDF